MSVESVLSRIRATFHSSLDMRSSIEDEVEWEVAMGVMQVGTPDRIEVTPSINVYIKLIRLDEADCGIETMIFEPLPLNLCTNEFLSQWIDDTWDALVLRGLEVSIDYPT